MRRHTTTRTQTLWITEDHEEFLSEHEAQRHQAGMRAERLPHIKIDDQRLAEWKVIQVMQWPDAQTATEWQASLTWNRKDRPWLLENPESFPCIMVILYLPDDDDCGPAWAAIPYDAWVARRTACMTAVEDAIASL